MIKDKWQRVCSTGPGDCGGGVVQNILWKGFRFITRMPGTRQCDTQPPANRESLPSLAGPLPQGGGFGNIRRTNQRCRRPRERKSGCGLGARPQGQLQTMNSCPCGGQDTWSQNECALPPKFPGLLGKGDPVVWEAENRVEGRVANQC